MTQPSQWERCVHHRGTDAEQFAAEYYAQEDRKVLLIGGAGFDPRTQEVAKSLSEICGDRLTGLFVREERPNATESLRAIADENDAKLRALIPEVDIFSVDVFGIDNAPVGGRRATRQVHERMDLTDITDVVLDCSALSVGVMFPIARYCLQQTRACGHDKNFHINVLDDPEADASIISTSCGKAAPLHTFSGGLSLDGSTDAARLWLPQLGAGRREYLNLIFQDVNPHAVCPIIPFPSTNPRAGDELMQEYSDLFEAISDPMMPTWNVDSRDIVYTHEKSPLDLYRSVLRIDDARQRVFLETGGSQLILSPLGSKAVAVGLLMAALERGFAVVSVESIEYRLAETATDNRRGAELVHLWLHGQAYNSNEEIQDVSS